MRKVSVEGELADDSDQEDGNPWSNTKSLTGRMTIFWVLRWAPQSKLKFHDSKTSHRNSTLKFNADFYFSPILAEEFYKSHLVERNTCTGCLDVNQFEKTQWMPISGPRYQNAVPQPGARRVSHWSIKTHGHILQNYRTWKVSYELWHFRHQTQLSWSRSLPPKTSISICSEQTRRDFQLRWSNGSRELPWL
jgi:hypothetical protein